MHEGKKTKTQKNCCSDNSIIGRISPFPAPFYHQEIKLEMKPKEVEVETPVSDTGISN
jgi:hypothetical protein